MGRTWCWRRFVPSSSGIPRRCWSPPGIRPGRNSARTAVSHPGITPPPRGSDGTPDLAGWAVANGIPGDAIVPIGLTPNIAMPHVVREADVALFANRCEGRHQPGRHGVPGLRHPDDRVGQYRPHRTAGARHRVAAAAARHAAQPRITTPPIGARATSRKWSKRLETVWRDRAAAAAQGRARGTVHGDDDLGRTSSICCCRRSSRSLWDEECGEPCFTGRKQTKPRRQPFHSGWVGRPGRWPTHNHRRAGPCAIVSARRRLRP